MRILVVDDERSVAELLREALKKRGHEVDVALNGARGLQLIEANPYDFAFLDVNMPEITGLELVKYIKEKDLKTVTVLITGYEVMEDFLARSVGVDEYLRKPFRISEIEAILHRYTMQPSGPKHPPGEKTKILILDDDAELTQLLAERLSRAGYEVSVANDSQDGLKKIYKDFPGLIILDLWLKPLPGEEVCKIIRENENEQIAGIPVLMLSGKKTEADRIVGKMIGANCYLTKPVNAEELLKQIQKILEIPSKKRGL